MVRIILTATALLAALPAAAQVDETAKAQLVSAIASAGCRVTPENNGGILAAAALTEEQAAAIVESMLTSGEAVPEGDVLVLKTGGCN
jgi:Spy/CpxP family protein refolding chaperone